MRAPPSILVSYCLKDPNGVRLCFVDAVRLVVVSFAASSFPL